MASGLKSIGGLHGEIVMDSENISSLVCSLDTFVLFLLTRAIQLHCLWQVGRVVM